ncbi:MAG TPA: hypothetical protein VG603_13970, partial [Chitinophagales bacterium]|nr:hypothetical protein [Chitinophagales bacterium]
MKKTFTLLSVISATLFNFAFGQTSIYKQNFDAATTFPTGWNATASSWYVDSTNNSTGYTGASGVNNVVIENKSATSGFDTLYSSSVSTVGYSDISVIWAARNTNHFSDSGSAIIGFYWSTDGGATWNNIAYTENATNSTWAIDNNATPIALPA